MLDAVRFVGREKAHFLVVGQRWDLDILEPLDFSEGWVETLRARVQLEGQLHGQTGSDYFIYPRECYKDIPDFAVGRAGWDNWMIFQARWMHWPLVDATQAMTVIHQNHDYAHLPGGIKHFYQPETADNVQKAGGRLSIFRLTDANHVLVGKQIHRKVLNGRSFWREVEIFPLVSLHSRILGWLSFALFHPQKAFKALKGWLNYKYKQNHDE